MYFAILKNNAISNKTNNSYFEILIYINNKIHKLDINSKTTIETF